MDSYVDEKGCEVANDMEVCTADYLARESPVVNKPRYNAPQPRRIPPATQPPVILPPTPENQELLRRVIQSAPLEQQQRIERRLKMAKERYHNVSVILTKIPGTSKISLRVVRRN